MKTLSKLRAGDKVAIVSPSFAAPGVWPHIYELGLERLRTVFGLVPIAYPTTAKVGAGKKERAVDLIAAFSDPEIKAVIASIGGDDQVTYIKHLPSEPFANNPKPFFGFSDNSHFCNFLFSNDIPSFYGGSLFTQFAMQGAMDDYTIEYIKFALFEAGEKELIASPTYNDQGLPWEDPETMKEQRTHWNNPGFIWSQAPKDTTGRLWGGCVESVDEMLRHNICIPALQQFEEIVLMLETSEELPTAPYVYRVLRALGERGILERVQGVLVGRAKAWEFDNPKSNEEKELYRQEQQAVFEKALEQYNQSIPLVQNLNFGHTDPNIPMPYGSMVRIDATEKRLFATF